MLAASPSSSGCIQVEACVCIMPVYVLGTCVCIRVCIRSIREYVYICLCVYARVVCVCICVCGVASLLSFLANGGGRLVTVGEDNCGATE